MFTILLRTERGILNSLICAFHFSNRLNSHSFLQGWNPPFLSEPHPFWVPPLSEVNFKKLPLLSESDPNWCM